MDRRDFLTTAAVLVGAPLLQAAIPSAAQAAAKKTTTKPKSKTTTTKPSTTAAPKAQVSRKVRLGFIALTDSAPLVAAKELGYFTERGLDVSLEKQASWPALRDAVLNNQIDGAHALFSMPFSVAAGIGGNGSTALKIAMMLNQNGQGITMEKSLAGAGYGDIGAAGELLKAKSPTMAMTFPGGTHDMWLRYWLKACGVDSTKVKIIAVPPPQMVANMKANAMDVFCVGEPWNGQAVFDKIGFTHLATQDLWTHHPEKCLMVNEKFESERREVLADVMGAVLKASRWLDDLKNRQQFAETLAKPAYVNTQANTIRSRLIGQYNLGGDLGFKEFGVDNMQFFRNGEVSFPRRAHGTWFLAQYERLGLAKNPIDYANWPSKLILSDLYSEVAAKEKVTVPNDDMAAFTVKLDKAEFDPKNPKAEVSRV